jgi:hypothetical protein
MQNKTRNICNLVAKALRDRERGKLLFQAAGEALDAARELGAPTGEKIGPLRPRKRGPQIPEFARIVDNWRPEVTHAYRPARFDRFAVEEWKEPKEKKAKTPEPETAAPAGDAAP